MAIGPALVLDTEGVRITHRTVAAGAGRRPRSPGSASPSTKPPPRPATPASGSPPSHGPAIGNIFGAQQSAFEDPRPSATRLENLIRTHSYSAEYAVSRVIRDYVKRLEDAALKLPEHSRAEARRRVAEFIDIEKQILVRLLGQNSEPLQELTEPVVVLANDLMPSDTADFTPRTVFAFATESGGDTSHTAILAEALEIPAVVGLGRFLTDVSGGDTVIVDGERRRPHHRPGRGHDRRATRRSGRRLLARADRYESLRDKPAVTARRRADPAAREHRTGPRGAALPRPRRRGRRACTAPSSST